MMQLNADFSEKVIVHAGQLPWIDSPIAGVKRRMLDRIGDEVARATSIVRYDPGSQFSPHVHTGGEEFVVLDGVFQDEHGDFPAGSYIRNPPESRHTPGSEPGCTIFVKLWQFDLADRTHVRTDINKIGSMPDRQRDGVTVIPLFKDDCEVVSVEHWAPQTCVVLNYAGGAELLVLSGSLEINNDTLVEQSWCRLPIGCHESVRAGETGARVWLKTGHLNYVTLPG